MTSIKLHTGDLFLANRWTLDALLGHLIDKSARWSDVGIIVVRDPAELIDNNDPSNQHLEDQEPLVNVFLLTNAGAVEVSLDAILRDPLLQTAAFRTFSARSNIKLITELKDAVQEFKGVSKENIMVLVEQEKGNHVDRTGFTSAEVIAGVLDEAGVVNKNNRFAQVVSSFQQGGYFDQYYGSETALYPRSSSADVKETLLAAAHRDGESIMMDYANSKPLSGYHVQNSSPKMDLRFKASNYQPSGELNSKMARSASNGSLTRVDKAKKLSLEEEVFSDNQVNIAMPKYAAGPRAMMVEQMSNHDRHQKKKGAVVAGQINASASMDSKIRHTKQAAAAYARPNPSYASK